MATNPDSRRKHWTHDRLRAKAWEGQAFEYAQHKLNGYRCTFFKQPDGSIVGYGKDDSPHLEYLARYPRLQDHPVIEAMRSPKFPVVSSLDCELVVPANNRVTRGDGAVFSDVPTALLDPLKPLDIIGFAIPWWRGEDVSSLAIGFPKSKCEQLGIPFAPYVRASEMLAEALEWRVTDLGRRVIRGDLLVAHHTKLCGIAASRGIEGWVLKVHGQATKWYKVKPQLDVDAVITGVKPGLGKFDGYVGALLVSVYEPSSKPGKPPYLRQVASVSGMTDHDRDWMTTEHKRNRLIGRVVEIKYQYLTDAGRCFHPRFVRFRPDKPASQCTWDQLVPSAGE